MNKVDEVAKAIHLHLAASAPPDGHMRYWETAPKPVKDFARDLARVAIKAMLKPTDDMLAAAKECDSWCSASFAKTEPENLYAAMIGTALKEENA